VGDRDDPSPSRLRRGPEASALLQRACDGREPRDPLARGDLQDLEGTARGPAHPSADRRHRGASRADPRGRDLGRDAHRPREHDLWQLSGVNWIYGDPRKHYARPGGRFLDARDEDEKRRVVFLGYELAEDIFGKEDPVGKTLSINNSPFTVIGVMQTKTQSSAYGGQDKNHAVIPITTYRALFGNDRLWVLVVHTKTPEEMEPVLAHANEIMAARYGYDPKDEHVWGIWNTVKSQATGEKIRVGMEIFFGIIGALTLVIGCVGVANIMYAVVKERTREIGVKMALGARRAWITGPFLLEGMLYTFVGGFAGAAIAIVIVTLLGLIPQEEAKVLQFLGKPTLSWPIGAATVAILGTAGLLAGYFPARRAAAIDPAATLRYE
jgi:putative ABC transport system permease protein